MSVNGGPKKPAFHPDTGITEWFAFGADRAMLIRVTQGNGKLLPNSYRWESPDIGPDPSRHSRQFWSDELASQDSVQQLECMVWLSGVHLTSRDPREKGVSREPVSESQVYESLRGSGSIKRRLRELAHSGNRWVAEYAALTLTRLASPQEEE